MSEIISDRNNWQPAPETIELAAKLLDRQVDGGPSTPITAVDAQALRRLNTWLLHIAAALREAK